MSAYMSNKKKTQNVNSIVRVRPLVQKEKDANCKNIVQFLSAREIATKDKKYNFDRVFTPECSQLDVYLSVVAPMIPDVISGYNCTVFAYGQTGTGKTYTMSGGDPYSTQDWRQDPTAGIIPRAAINIFDHIHTYPTNADHSVRVSYLELYNEEVRDLLSDSDHLPPLNIFNDPNNKGSVCIQGLKEVTVCNRNDIYELLAMGTSKRQTAPTLMNHNSSRSHTVFTISVFSKSISVNNEEIMKLGKLNLVDLAGSENIARSGAKDVRAVELGNINKSLLTLGRVIHTLVDKKTQHVPYRDSKLTRILQDSLGGKTKTCIIATISPSSSCYEETVSTLEYAHRARDITNCPTINERTTKNRLLDKLQEENDRLQKDLDAARGEAGSDAFLVNKGNFDKLIADLETFKEESRKYKEDLQIVQAQLAQMEDVHTKKDQDLREMGTNYEIAQQKIMVLEEALRQSEGEKYVLDAIEGHDNEITKVARQLLNVVTTSTSNEEKLHNKVAALYNISSRYEHVTRNTLDAIFNILGNLQKQTETFLQLQGKGAKEAKDNIKFITTELDNLLTRTEYASMSLKDEADTLICNEPSCDENRIASGFKEQDEICENAQQNIVPEVEKFVQTVVESTTSLKDLIDTNKKQFKDIETQAIDIGALLNKLESDNGAQLVDIGTQFTASYKDKHEILEYVSQMQSQIRDKQNELTNEEERNMELIRTLLQQSEERKQAYSVNNELLKKIEEGCRNAIQLDHATQCQSTEAFAVINATQEKIKELIPSLQSLQSTSNRNLVDFHETVQKHCEEILLIEPQFVDQLMGALICIKEKTKILQTNVEEKFRAASTQTQELQQQVRDIVEKCTKTEGILVKPEDLLTFSNEVETTAQNAQKLIQTECLEVIKPVVHGGDTPKRPCYTYPKELKAVPSRTDLLKMYYEERKHAKKEKHGKKGEENKENNRSFPINTSLQILHKNVLN